jgi:hypothetical protein
MRRLFFLLLSLLVSGARSLNVLIAGGTGPVGQTLAARLKAHNVCILCRNSFLASAPIRASGQFGWVGAKFLESNPHVRLRDWDGGDLLDIVGQDWIGWQDDSLKDANVVVHLVGGYTEQRIMACERIVRESLRLNSYALQLTVNPTDKDLPFFPAAAQLSLKKKRVEACEAMVTANCPEHVCLRIDAYNIDKACDEILSIIEGKANPAS